MGEFQAEIYKQAADIKEQAAEIVDLIKRLLKAIRRRHVFKEKCDREITGIR